MPDGGTLTIGLRESGENVTISVTDTGEGMDAATAEKCFEPFFTTKGGMRGTGLGLATVHTIVTGAGGDITLATEPGRGTTFTIVLPRFTESGEPVPVTEHASHRRGGTERVLVVEDEDGLRRLATEVLRGAGYIVTAAADGQAALAAVEEDDEPDLVVTDVVMPRLGGVELAHRLAAAHPDLPVLFMTGYVDQTSREGLHGADVVIKPFLVEELVDKVREVLDREPAGAEAGVAHGSKR